MLSVPDAARRLGVSRTTVGRWIANGTLVVIEYRRRGFIRHAYLAPAQVEALRKTLHKEGGTA